jgi:hypothetical protein
VLDLAVAQLVDEGHEQPGAGGAQGVAQHDHRAAVDVHHLLVGAEHAGGVQRDRGEGLVDLQQGEVVQVPAGLLERLLQRDRRDGVEVGEPVGAHAVGEDLGKRLHAERLGALGAHHHHGGRPVRELGGVPGGDGPRRGERRRRRGQGLLGGLGADALVAFDHRGPARGVLDGDADDLAGEPP